VKAIIKFEDKIFVGGSFTMAGGIPADNVAYWDASGWHSAGCVQGEIRDFAVFEGNLYAGGDFDDCIALTGSDFAKWDGAAWHAIPGITGAVNTLQPVAGSLLIGGAISFGPYPANAIKWNETTSYVALANNIANEVMDFEVFQDTVYASCKRTDAIDTANLLMLLRGDTWQPAFWIAGGISSFFVPSGSLSFNSLCAEPTSLAMGGHFNYYPMMGTYAQNTIALNGDASWIAVDSTVNKVVLFKNELYAGGKFKNGSGPGWGGTIMVNGIARRETPGVGVPELSNSNAPGIIYPNPASAGSTIHISTAINATHYMIIDITGKQQAAGTIDNKQQIVVPDVPAGLYFITLVNETGGTEKMKLAVE
jgi:trimeric autotransporter adhesin